MKYHLIVYFLVIFALGFYALPESNAEIVPDWVKNTAGWWADDAISEKEFVNAIEFLVNNGIITTDKQLTSITELESFFKKIVIDERGPKKNLITPYINPDGFRGPDISQIPIGDTYRIFGIGGSTTFGIGGPDGTSWPDFLQEKLNSIDTIRNVEVINAGIPSATSYQNSNLIKNKLVDYEPDLMIIYEGGNDQACALPLYDNSDTDFDKEFVERLCGVHAEKAFFEVLAERYSDICSFGQKNNFDVIVILQPTVMLDSKILTDQELAAYFVRSAYGVMLDDYDILVNTVLEKTNGCHSVVDMTDIFTPHDIPIYFDYIHPTHVGNEIIAQEILKTITPLLVTDGILPSELIDVKSNTSSFNFKFKDDQKNTDFSSQTIDDESFLGQNLSGNDFSNSIIKNTDFRLANLDSTNFVNAKFDNIQLRQNTFKNADFTNVDFENVDLTHVDFSEAILVGADLSGNISYGYKDLSKTFFYKADLTGASLSYSDLTRTFLNDVKITNADLSNTLLYENAFNTVYNNDISGINFNSGKIQYSDFEGLSFNENDLTQTIFYNSKLKNTNFSNLSVIHDVVFAVSDLTNANFEGVEFLVSDIYVTTFPGKAHLCGYEKCLDPRFNFNDRNHFFNDNYTRQITNVELIGDDVLVTFIYRTTFALSNLENVSFENVVLQHALFWDNDNLSSVNFKNADLSLTIFQNSDLTGVDFTDAIITENTIFENTIMDCIGHEVCTT